VNKGRDEETVISKNSKVTLGILLIIVAAVGFTVRSSIYAEDAMSKTKTLDVLMTELTQAQIKLTGTVANNKAKSEANAKLLQKLSEVQIQQQLILNTQNVELKYIKKGIKDLLKQGG